MRKLGSATVVIVMFAIVFMLYCTSTYADVRQLENNYIEYEKNIIEKYEIEYNDIISEL